MMDICVCGHMKEDHYDKLINSNGCRICYCPSYREVGKSMEGLTVGRMVHYISYDTPSGEYLLMHRAAVVVDVIDKTTGEVSLCVLNPSGIYFDQNAMYSEIHKPGTWHWIEKA